MNTLNKAIMSTESMLCYTWKTIEDFSCLLTNKCVFSQNDKSGISAIIEKFKAHYHFFYHKSTYHLFCVLNIIIYKMATERA